MAHAALFNELAERKDLAKIDPKDLPQHYFVRGVGAIMDFCPKGWYHSVMAQVKALVWKQESTFHL